MVQIIQHKRRIAGAAGPPPTLSAGELAFNSNGLALYVGADAAGGVADLVSAARQLEIVAGDQTVAAGVKTWAAGAKIAIGVADLSVSGGAAGEVMSTDGAGALSWIPAGAASAGGDVVGPASAVDNNIAVYNLATGKLIKDGGRTIQSIIDYVDTEINNIPGATPPEVAGPELTGDGTAATPITFTGITIAANSTASLVGKGLSTNALDLVLVDGGTY